MFNALDSFMPFTNSHGDAWVHEPQNAWSGASADIIVTTVYIGPNKLVQIGRDLTDAGGGVWSRIRDMTVDPGDDEWSDWQALVEPNPPTLTSITPTTHDNDGADWTLTAHGTGFTADMQIKIDGGAVTTIFDSPTQMHTVITTDQTPDTYDVVVGYGAGLSTPPKVLTVTA